jgi:hypothetical protein
MYTTFQSRIEIEVRMREGGGERCGEVRERNDGRDIKGRGVVAHHARGQNNDRHVYCKKPLATSTTQPNRPLKQQHVPD